MPLHRKRWIVLVLALAIGGGLVAAWPTLATAALLMDLGGFSRFPRTLLPFSPVDTTAHTIAIPTRHGAVAARVERPIAGATGTMVVLPGVHAAGLDEPRLTRFSRALAGAGLTVVTVPLPDLRAFRIVGRSTDQAEDVAAWVSSNQDLAPNGRISLAGVSFAGGLALVAAGRPSLTGRLDAAISLGGHGDLGQVLEYLCTGTLPDGSARPPHDYSLAVVALTAAPLLVPAADIPSLERAILLFLQASSDESAERSHAEQLLAQASRLRDSMTGRSRQVMNWVLDRDVASLGAAIRPFIAELARDPALSPERSPAARVPVFLLHGRDDNVIPPSEIPRLAAYLDRHGTPVVQSLVTPVLSHVGIDTGVSAADWWRLVRFWRAMDDAVR